MRANSHISAVEWERLEACAPENPFLTSEYALARERLGQTPLMLEEGSDLCLAFLKRGRITCALEVTSLPFSPSTAFLSGLADLCRERRIYETALHTFASRPLRIPRLPREIERRIRTEFLLDLTVPASEWKIGKAHRQQIRRAERSAVSVRRVRSEGIPDHLAMRRHSLSRRRDRGEPVPPMEHSPELPSVVLSGAGELFQAVKEGVVLSSMLVIRTRTGAYFYSGGTSKEGMQTGASHFLMHSVARALQEDGLRVFNLGSDIRGSPGLRDFKSRFGTTPVETEAVRAVLCGTAHRMLVEAYHALKRIGLG